MRVLGRVETLPRPAPGRRARRSRPRGRRGPRGARARDAPRRATSSTAFSSSSRARSRIPGCASRRALRLTTRRSATSLRRLPARPTAHHSYAGGLLEHTVGVATICRETAQLHPAASHRPPARRRAAARRRPDARARRAAPTFRPTEEGRLLGHVHLGLRLVEERARRARRRPCGRSSCTRSHATTTRAAAAPPRRRCSTTRISSTRSPRRGPVRTASVADDVLALGRERVAGDSRDFFGAVKRTPSRRARASLVDRPGRQGSRRSRSSSLFVGGKVLGATPARSPPSARVALARSGSPRSTAAWRSARSASSRRSRRLAAVVPVVFGLATRRPARDRAARRDRARARRRLPRLAGAGPRARKSPRAFRLRSARGARLRRLLPLHRPGKRRRRLLGASLVFRFDVHRGDRVAVALSPAALRVPRQRCRPSSLIGLCDMRGTCSSRSRSTRASSASSPFWRRSTRS